MDMVKYSNVWEIGCIAVTGYLTLLGESLPTEPSDDPLTETSRGNRNRCSSPGILYNTNTLEGFHALDKQGLLKSEAKKEKQMRTVLCYRVLDPPATLVDLRPASKWFTPEEAESVSTCCNEWRNSSLTVDVPWNIKKVQFLCYRENHGFADLDLSLVGEALIQQSQVSFVRSWDSWMPGGTYAYGECCLYVPYRNKSIV
nr:hypothetical protein [Tanacetum cinerariifolium]